MATCLEADRIDGAVDVVGANDLCDHVGKPVVLGEVNRFKADLVRMAKPVLVEVASHDDVFTQYAAACGQTKGKSPNTILVQRKMTMAQAA